MTNIWRLLYVYIPRGTLGKRCLGQDLYSKNDSLPEAP